MSIRVAYLNTQYPKLSHTFIEREIAGLRRAGIEVETFSIRPPAPSDLLSVAHREEAARTLCLLDSPARLAAGALASAMARPAGALRGLARAQRLSSPGLVPRAVHAAYLVEAARLARDLRRRGLDHIHVHMANNGAMVALLACAIDPRLSYSLTIHGSAEFFDVHRLALGAKTSGALFVRCISDFCRAQVMAWSRPDVWERFHVVHCGVDVARFAARAPGWARDRRPDGPLRLLSVGRLEAIKGYPLLIDALAEARRRGVDASLTMVGDGPMRARIESRVSVHALSGRVALVGPVGQDAIHEHFDRSDALVVSSFMEGVPVVLMEAMAKAMPVISTSVGGVPELVEDGVSGFLARTGSVESLAGAIERLAGAGPGMEDLGRAGRRRVEREFDIEDSARRMADLLERALKPRE